MQIRPAPAIQKLTPAPLTPEERLRKAMGDTAPFVAHQINLWAKHVDEFGYTRKPGDKMPRANAWRPYRFAVQDVIFAITAIRHAKESNSVEVDVFLAFDPKYADVVPEGHSLYPYEPLAAARALTLMILSEAFRCGAALRLRFTHNVERTDDERATQERDKTDRGRVPAAILQLAAMHGVTGIEAESGVLKPAQAGPLYAALTGFPANLADRVRGLADQGLLSIERACYLVQHGVWTVPELEGLIRGCPYPDLILDGEIQPEQRHLYHHAQVHARTALLGGVLDRALLARDAEYTGSVTGKLKSVKGRAEGATPTINSVAGQPAKPGLDVEDDDRDLLITFDPDLSARRYRLGVKESELLPLPDWRPFAARDGAPPWKDRVPRDGELIALLRPRDEAGLLQYLEADIAAAAGCARGADDCVAVVVPLDFNDLRTDRQHMFLEQAAQANNGVGVWLLVCPETARTLDGYAREKLNRSRVLPE